MFVSCCVTPLCTSGLGLDKRVSTDAPTVVKINNLTRNGRYCNTMSVATVVGMVVTIQKKDVEDNRSNLEKSFLSFPDEKEREVCYQVKMLMVDG